MAALRPARRAPSGAAPHVALLRGINVGGRNRLPMADLAAVFAAEGCAEVRTYIQSGNVLFLAPAARAGGLAGAVEGAIAARFGFRVPVVIRTASDLARVARGNPFLAAGADPATLHVAFLAGPPAPARVAALDPRRSPPDAFAVRGREVYLHFPNGVARSRITNAWLDAALRTTSTVRNWRTVLELLARAAAAPGG